MYLPDDILELEELDDIDVDMFCEEAQENIDLLTHATDLDLIRSILY